MVFYSIFCLFLPNVLRMANVHFRPNIRWCKSSITADLRSRSLVDLYMDADLMITMIMVFKHGNINLREDVYIGNRYDPMSQNRYSNHL